MTRPSTPAPQIEPVGERWASIGGPITVGGFAIAVAVWVAWLITHLPWVGMDERLATGLVLATWLVGAVVLGRCSPAYTSWKVGLGAGAVSALLGLLLVGTRLEIKAPGLGALEKPSTQLLIGGFILLGAVVGVVGAILGRASLSPARRAAAVREAWRTWLSRMGVVAIVGMAPLLFVGGLVTSTNAGMAVPDWPNTYGANMFLYPLRPDLVKDFTPGMDYTDVFLEHSHRLFGALVGLTTLVLMVLVLRHEPRRWVRALAVGVFLLVVVQGILGGKRVLLGHHEIELDNRWWSMLHGILGQLVFAAAVVLSVVLTPRFAGGGSAVIDRAKLLRICATGMLHSTVLQLVFGAMYRHHRADHALYAHIAFSVVVLVTAMLAGVAATTAKAGGHGAASGIDAGPAPVLRQLGVWVMAIVGVQFLLGWVALLTGGSGIEARTVWEALVRTAHQANGALFLAVGVALYVWAKRALRSAGAGVWAT